MVSKPSVYLFDLWKTLGYSIDRDPILSVQEMLGHNVALVDGEAKAQPDADFMRLCLTTDIADPRAFLNHIARTFGRTASREAHAAFETLLRQERGGFELYADTEPALRELRQQGTRLGLISNLWPFPVDHIFNGNGLGDYFEHRIFSFEVGFQKPDPEIFKEALERFHVAPEECVMVGDNPVADVEGALAVGMRAALIDRAGKASTPNSGCVVLRSLLDLGDPELWNRTQ
jgi:HAD superfamily hydrolase (TIGR01509 family)